MLAFYSLMPLLYGGDATPASAYACPMHPEVTAAEPGTCPKCGMKLVAVPAGTPASYACPMHPDVTAPEPGTCPQCGMKLVASDAPAPPAAEPGQDAAHDHDHGDDLEWEDLMPQINRVSDSGNMIWQLIDRQTGAVNGDISWSFTVGDRVKIRLVNEMDWDHPMHHPFHVHGACRFLILSRDGKPEPNLVWKDTVLLRAGEIVDILLDVSNPGLWMAHCHIAEHNQSGMMFSFDVSLLAWSRPNDRRARGRAPGRAGNRRRLRLAWPWATTWRSAGCLSRSWMPALRSALRGARGGIPAGGPFTPAQYDNLPGLPFPSSPVDHPGKDDVADYLQAYAAKFELPVRPDTMVTSLTRSNGVYVVTAGGEALEALEVVVATGPFQVPIHPAHRQGVDPRRTPAPQRRVPQPGNHAARNGPGRRRRELRLPDRPGALRDPRRGTLGRPAAPRHPAAAAGPRRVVVGEHAGAGPGDGRLAARKAPGRARPGDRARAATARPRHGIRLRPRATRAAGRTVTFADGDAAKYDAVVWATGFTTDHTWIDIPGVTGKQGHILTHVASRPHPASTCSATRGRAPEPRRCSAGCGTTRPSSPSGSRPAQMKARTRPGCPRLRGIVGRAGGQLMRACPVPEQGMTRPRAPAEPADVTATEVPGQGPALPGRLARSLRGAGLSGAPVAGPVPPGRSCRCGRPTRRRRATHRRAGRRRGAAGPPGRRGGARRQRVGHHRCARAV